MHTVRGCMEIIIQICHASVGNMTECFPREDGFPEGGARGKTILPRHICFIILNKARSQMTGDSHIPR